MKNPKVSIVCISYNHEKFIGDSIDSFLLQETNFEYEIIIADDASLDKTQSIISGYAKNNKKITPILRPKNVGVQANLLGAMSIAKGKYIALCEGDDFWTDPLKLQLQVDFLDKHEDFSICFHQVEVFFNEDHDKKHASPDKKDYPRSMNVEVADLLKGNFIPTNSVMYRRQGDYNLNKKVMPLDWYLHAYHAKFGRIHYIDRMMAKNRRHEDGVWWAAETDSNVIWIKYKKGWVELFNEFFALYGDIEDNRKIIQANFSNFIKILFKNQSEKDFKIISQSINRHLLLQPGLIEGLLMKAFELHDEVERLSEHSNNQGLIIESQKTHIDDLVSELEYIKKTWWWRVKTAVKSLRDKL